MRRLHGSDDVKFGKAGEIHGRDNLRVLDAVAAVSRAIGLPNCFEHIQRDAVGAIAYSVESELEAGLVALNGHRRELLRVDCEDSTGGWIVSIGLEHCRGARTHGSIRESFQCACL